MSEQSISFRSKVFTSTKLSTLQFASSIGLRLISTVVLTRLLNPEAYGVFAIVLLYIYIFEMFSDLGLRSLVLTKEGEVEDDFLRTCWTVAILRGLVIALISSAVAGAIAVMQEYGIFASDSAYAAAVLPFALAVVGGTVVVTSFQSPMIYMSERNMDFGRVTVVQIALNITALIATVALAIWLRSVWALVLGNLIRAIIQVALTFLMFPGPAMRFCLNRTHLKTVVDRGKWIIGHSMLTAMANAGDRIVLGLMMTSTTFGFYYIARQLVDVVMSFLMSINARIGLQIFTHLHQASIADFRRNYYRYRLFFDALAGTSAGMLVILSPLLIALLFDDRYQGVAEIVQTLVWGLLLIGPTLLRSAFSAERRFKQMTLLSVVTTLTLWTGLGIAFFFFDSVYMALVVIALHKLPEAMIITLWGGERDWVVIWREFLSFGFCAMGLLLGTGLLFLWNALT